MTRALFAEAGWLLAIALACPIVTLAEDEIGVPGTAPAELEGPEQSASSGEWDVRIGVLGALQPEYEGSGDYSADVIPLLHVNWRDRLIFHGRSLDVVAYGSKHFRIGPMLRIRGGRDADDDSILDGLGDVDRAYEVGGFARYTHGPFLLRVNATTDVSGAHDGSLVEVGVELRAPRTDPWCVLRVASTWASADYTQTFFGVDTEQVVRSRLRAFDADAGFKDVRIEFGARRPVMAHVWALASVGYLRLLGDAARSPIVAQHGDADQFFISLGAMYRF